jgi:hypothetical protein
LDKQLEDNSTKALMNVLEYSNRDLTRSFLDSLVGWKGTDADFEYFLQDGPKLPAMAKCLLALSNRGEIDASSWESTDGGSRVDGSIHSAGTLTVFIETKVVDNRLNGSQLLRHAAKWGMPGAVEDSDGWKLPPEWNIRKWEEVYEWARRESGRTERQPDKFLLGQLIEYLELTGLAPTWTLRAEHFEFFRKPTDERDAALGTEIRTRLDSIWIKVIEQLGPDDRKVLGKIHVGNLGEGAVSAWAQTNADEGFHVPNLTIEMDKNELNLNIVGGFDQQAKRVKRWLCVGGGAGLAESNFELVIFRRTAKGGHDGKNIVWQRAKWELVERTPLRALTPTDIKARLEELPKSLDDKTQRLAFHIRKKWACDAVRERQDLPAELAREISQLLPILKEIRKA